MEFFRKMSQPAMLEAIQREVRATTKNTTVRRGGIAQKTTRRGRSRLLLAEIHKAAGDKHLPGCVSAEAGCLRALMHEVMDEKNAFEIIDAVYKIIQALYDKPNVLSQMLSDFSVSIQREYPDSKISEYAKRVLHLSDDEKTAKKKNYTAKIYHDLGNQRQLLDTDILKHINVLRYSEKWIDLIVCVGLSIGSRLIEIIDPRVSSFSPAENPLYVRVEGVAKDRNAKEGKIGPENKRTFIKPIIGGLIASELIDLINKIRQEVIQRYDPIERKLSRRDLTNLIDARVNKKIREVLGEGYTFHATRGIYAAIAWEQYRQEGQSQTWFFSQVLGHQENSLQVSLGYQKFAVRRSIKPDDPDLAAKVTTLQEQLHGIAKLKESVNQTISHAQSIKPAEVFLKNKDGKLIAMKRQPHFRNGDHWARFARIQEAALDLIKNGINPTCRNLSKLGFGSSIINEWKKTVHNPAKKGFLEENQYPIVN